MRKIDPQSAAFTGLDQRVAPRSDVYCRLPFVLCDGRQEMATCVNISADGMLLRFERGLTPGDMLIVKLPIIGRMAGRVIWNLSGKIGLQFDRMIPVQDYLPMLKALGGPSRPH